MTLLFVQERTVKNAWAFFIFRVSHVKLPVFSSGSPMPKQNTESSVGASKRKDLRKKGVSKHKRAGLTFPVSRVHRAFKKGNFSPRIGLGAAIVTTAALEYLAAEIFELAGKAAAANEKKVCSSHFCFNGNQRITPRYLMLAIKNDAELSKVCLAPCSSNVVSFLRTYKSLKVVCCLESNPFSSTPWSKESRFKNTAS